MKNWVYILAFIFLPVWGSGQIYQSLPNFYQPIDSSALQASVDKKNDPVDFGVTIGTGFTSFSGYGTMNSYVAPHMQYQVNSNLSLNFSAIISNINASPFGGNPGIAASQNSMMPLNQDNRSYGFSVGGIYQPNNNMYVRAQGQYAENSMSPFSLYPYQNHQAPGFNAFSLGMGYKFSEKTSIDFEFRFSNGSNRYYNPYYAPYSPINSFNRNPFLW